MSNRKEIPEVAHLRRALRRILRGWTQQAFAKKADGTPVHYTDKDAVCWCASGAIFSTCYNPSVCSSERARQFFKEAAGTINIPGWNDVDGRKKEEVVEAFKKAINLARRTRVDQPTT